MLCFAAPADYEVVRVGDDVCLKTLFVPQFLPSKHEAAHVKIAEKRTDRRALWGSWTSVPIARTPTPIAPLIGFFDRHFQPFEQFLEAVSSPYEDKPGQERYAMPARPEECVLQTFCGT
jgi:hypothetical protein